MSKFPHLKVELLTHTPSPEWIVAIAARLCYSPLDGNELKESITGEKIKSLIDYIIERKHFSVLEHASFTFLLEGVSRVTTHQLVRHRIGCSYSQKSQRYVKEKGPQFIVPPTIAGDEEASKLFLASCEASHAQYNKLIELGIHKEEARYLLPQSIESKIIFTMSARALYNFFALRCCQRAQGEIQYLALRMKDLVLKVAPDLFAKAGPPCEVDGNCPEGDLSCGRYKKFQRGRRTN